MKGESVKRFSIHENLTATSISYPQPSEKLLFYQSDYEMLDSSGVLTMSEYDLNNNYRNVKKSMLQILDHNNELCGYGINLDNGFILTCTHIVLSALGLNIYNENKLIGERVILKGLYSTDSEIFESEIIYSTDKIDENNEINKSSNDLTIMKAVNNENYFSIQSCSLDYVSEKIKILLEIEERGYVFTEGNFSSSVDNNENLFAIQGGKYYFKKGDSGKPVLNEKGNICGIISTVPNTYDYSHDFAYCIGLEAFNTFLNSENNKALSKIELIDSYIESKDDVTLFNLLHNYGRSWIENRSLKKSFIPKLEKIKCSSSCNKSKLWANYLWSLHEMFSNLNAYKISMNDELFSEKHVKEAIIYNLEELFLAEYIEFKRKTGGKIYNILALTNILKFVLDAHHIRDDICNYGQEKRYAVATATFILAKVYKNGGLIKKARGYFEISKKWYCRGILSHDNEIAHCDYMINLLDMLLGQDITSKIREKSQNTTFLDGLNMMIISNHLWMKEKDDEAIKKIELASQIFKNIGYFDYEKKCIALKNTFRCWVRLENNQIKEAFSHDIDEHHSAIEYIVTHKRNLKANFNSWFSCQDPIRLLTILQFSKFKNPELKLDPFESKQFIIEEKNKLLLIEGDSLNSTSMNDAIFNLKARLELNNDVKRFPLILSG